MKWLFTILSIFTISSAVGDSVGDSALSSIATTLRQMGGYEADITIKAQGSTVEGHYRISGDDYHVDMGSVEIWGEGDKRYEVSHKIEEIVIERVDESGVGVLLKNPSRAFELVGQGFEVTLRDDTLTLIPKPQGANIDIDKILIYIDSESRLPRQITYEADTDCVSISFGEITPLLKPMERLKISSYKKYEVVDLY